MSVAPDYTALLSRTPSAGFISGSSSPLASPLLSWFFVAVALICFRLWLLPSTPDSSEAGSQRTRVGDQPTHLQAAGGWYIGEEALQEYRRRVEEKCEMPGAGPWQPLLEKDVPNTIRFTALRRSLPVRTALQHPDKITCWTFRTPLVHLILCMGPNSSTSASYALLLCFLHTKGLASDAGLGSPHPAVCIPSHARRVHFCHDPEQPVPGWPGSGLQHPAWGT